MTSKKVFKKDTSGAIIAHDLYNNYAGYSVIQFSDIKIFNYPGEPVSFCIYQWRDGLERLLDKVSYEDFRSKYIEEGAFLHFDPMSKVYLKLENASDFEFELSYELDVREHEPVYL